MIIDFEFSGGYGGLFAKQPLSHRLDVDSLPEPTHSELVGLVEASGARTLRLPTASGTRPGGQTYRLALSEAGVTNVIACDDVSAPASLRPLLAYLQRLALAARAGATPR